MKHAYKGIVLPLLVLTLLLGHLHAGDGGKITKTFKPKKLIRLRGMTGDYVIRKGEAAKIVVVMEYDGDALYKPEIHEDGDTLNLRGKVMSGEVNWNITAPADTTLQVSTLSGDVLLEGMSNGLTVKTISGTIEVKDCKGDMKFKTAGGRFEINNAEGSIMIKGASSEVKLKKLKGDVQIKVASGDIDVENAEGDISIKLSSGDVHIKRAKGAFHIKNVSGDINLKDVVVTGPSELAAVSGDVELSLSQSCNHDLTLASTSGNAVLDYDGNPVKGYFEFRVLKEEGRIDSPFQLDSQREEDKWGKLYVIRSFSKNGNTPKVYLKTATGKAVLKK